MQGRWLSPDPSGLAAVDPNDPQTWNRYAYVGNRPLNTTDPRGLDYVGDCYTDGNDVICGYQPDDGGGGGGGGGGDDFGGPEPVWLILGPPGFVSGDEAPGLPSELNSSALDVDSLFSFLPGLGCGTGGGSALIASVPASTAPCPVLVVVPVVTALTQALPVITELGPYNCTCEGINIQPIQGLCLTNCECTDTLPDRMVEFSMKTLKTTCGANLSCPRRITATEIRERIDFLFVTVEFGKYTPVKCDFFPPL